MVSNPNHLKTSKNIFLAISTFSYFNNILVIPSPVHIKHPRSTKPCFFQGNFHIPYHERGVFSSERGMGLITLTQ